jgi:hypothetical protein
VEGSFIFWYLKENSSSVVAFNSVYRGGTVVRTEGFAVINLLLSEIIAFRIASLKEVRCISTLGI